jgi:tRNA nucleotidyltransferase (CCA-adding enzyme)
MFKDFSYGAVVYKLQSGIPVFLLVNSKQNKIWGFPKGHPENNESEKKTAMREIFEETGIKKIKFIKNFKQEDIYIISSTVNRTRNWKIEKHSVYFLAVSLEDSLGSTFAFDKNEILEIKWGNINEAQNLLSYASQKKIVNLAHSLIIGVTKHE